MGNIHVDPPLKKTEIFLEILEILKNNVNDYWIENMAIIFFEKISDNWSQRPFNKFFNNSGAFGELFIKKCIFWFKFIFQICSAKTWSIVLRVPYKN